MRTNRAKIEMWKRGRLGVRQMGLKEFEVIEKVQKMTYPQDWPAYNAAKTQEKTIAQFILAELTEMLETLKGQPQAMRGRPSITLKDRIMTMFIYTYNKASSRRTIPELSMAKNLGLISRAPHFNSITNMFKDHVMMDTLLQLVEVTSMPLAMFEDHLTVDSTGFSCSQYESWMDTRTQQASKQKVWKKAHVVSGARTNIIASVVVTEGHCADGLKLAPLMDTASKRFTPKEVSADKAYLSRKNLKTIVSMGAVPYIPFKSNSTQKPRGCRIWNLMFGYFYNNKEEFMKHYHLRSNSETVFSMIKRTFGHKLRTKTHTSQINEILMKCLCHNLTVLVQESFELGLEIDLKKCLEEYFAQKTNDSAQK